MDAAEAAATPLDDKPAAVSINRIQLRVRIKPSNSDGDIAKSPHTQKRSASTSPKLDKKDAKKPKKSPFPASNECFLCGQSIYGSVDDLNEHLNFCLNRQNNDAYVLPANDDTYEEYEWNGTTRIRPASMILCHAADRVKELNVPDDLNIVEEETNEFGESQYGESALVSPRTTEAFYGEDAPLNVPRRSTGAASAEVDAQLLIESLCAKLRSQETLLAKAVKCLICMEAYDTPLASIGCWHVHCERCWLHSLGAKKVCPQCNIITKPSDLRRIYL